MACFSQYSGFRKGNYIKSFSLTDYHWLFINSLLLVAKTTNLTA